MALLGYDTKDRKITVNKAEAKRVQDIFRSYPRLALGFAARVEVQPDKLIVGPAKTKTAGPRRKSRPNVIEISWRKTPSKRRREILIPESQHRQDVRPIRSENRTTLVASIARGRRWPDELIADPTTNAESITNREGCTTRQVNMTISLAFLAPDLVKAAIQGRLPHGMGVRRLRDMPSEWHRQRQTLGL